jgi:hypothetical protein
VIVYRSEMEMLQERAMMDFLSSNYAIPTFVIVLVVLVGLMMWNGRKRR